MAARGMNKKKPQQHFPTVWSLVRFTIKYIVYVIIHFVYTTVQYHVIWRLSGTLKQLRNSHASSKEAQVLRILGCCRYNMGGGPSSLNDFLLVHERFVHATYIMRDNVDLYYIDDKIVVFTEAEEGIQQWRHEFGAFHRVVQCQQAVRVIVLPLSAAKRLADGLEDPKARLVFVANTGRCGSTLLQQIFESTDKCVVYGEPAALQMLPYMKYDEEPIENLIRIAIRFYCKPVRSPAEVLAYVFKPMHVASMDVVSTVHRVYPDASYVFMYRDAKKMAYAFQNIGYYVSPYGRLIAAVCYFSKPAAFIVRFVNNYYDLSTTLAMLELNFDNKVLFGIYFWAKLVANYNNLRKQGVKIVGFKFEDLLNNKEVSIERLFKHVGLPLTLVGAGAESMNRDSQNGSGVSTKELSAYGQGDFTPEVLQQAVKIFGMFHLSISLFDRAHLDDTISS